MGARRERSVNRDSGGEASTISQQARAADTHLCVRGAGGAAAAGTQLCVREPGGGAAAASEHQEQEVIVGDVGLH